jgi:hypothetical protein
MALVIIHHRGKQKAERHPKDTKELIVGKRNSKKTTK